MQRYRSLYTTIGIIGLAAALIGFSKTFIYPVAAGTFNAPAIVYVHGAFTFGWVVLFLIQAVLIKAENWKLHFRLGILGIVAAIGTAFTMPFVGKFQVDRDLALGLGETAISSILGTVTAAAVFLGFVGAAIWNRRKPDTHKRLMLIATIHVLWPAWFRFRHYFPSVQPPEIWFALLLADSLFVFAWIWDFRENGRVHPVLLYGSLFVITDHVFETFAFDSAPWRVVSQALWSLF
ncbi:MAG TPA: hypothetical protein PLK77_04540 [Pyrinomonadaceae bacterium]|nr:hypothetical protein [Pyrinomonadaceae bacterium]